MYGAVRIQVGLDGELKSVLSKLELKLQAKEQRSLSIITDFGSITHVQTDLFEVLHAHRIRVGLRVCDGDLFHLHTLCGAEPQVNPDHPIVREAHKNGNTIFVMTTLYWAEHCNVEVSFSEQTTGTAAAGVEASAGGVPLLGASAGTSLDDSKSTVKGVLLALWLFVSSALSKQLFPMLRLTTCVWSDSECIAQHR